MLYLRRIPASVQLQLQNVWRGVPPLSHTCAHLAHSRYDLSAPHLTHQLYFLLYLLPTFLLRPLYISCVHWRRHPPPPPTMRFTVWDDNISIVSIVCVYLLVLYHPQFACTCPLNKGHILTLPEETKLAIGWDLYRSSVIIWILSFDTLLFYHICLGFICRPGRSAHNPETLHHTPHEWPGCRTRAVPPPPPSQDEREKLNHLTNLNCNNWKSTGPSYTNSFSVPLSLIIACATHCNPYNWRSVGIFGLEETEIFAHSLHPNETCQHIISPPLVCVTITTITSTIAEHKTPNCLYFY